MLANIGAALIVIGFILGVYCGVVLSLRSAIISESGQVKQGKLTNMTVMCVVSVVMVMVGQYMFFLC